MNLSLHVVFAVHAIKTWFATIPSCCYPADMCAALPFIGKFWQNAAEHLLGQLCNFVIQ